MLLRCVSQYYLERMIHEMSNAPGLIWEGQQALDQFDQALQKIEELSTVTNRNYLIDLRQFIIWYESCWWEDRDG